MVHLGERYLEPVIYDKLTRWYWCGVFGELYGAQLRLVLPWICRIFWIGSRIGMHWNL